MGDNVNVISINPKDIKKGWRARQDYGDISELAESIKEIGQLQPVVVKKSKKGDKYVIIAGLRRTRACKKLGTKVKAVVIEPRDEMHNLTMQLAENVKRKNFDKLEVGDGLKRYKSIWEETYPEAKHGGAGRKRAKDADSPDRFTVNASKMLSISETSVKDLIGIASIPKEEKQKIDSKAITTRERNIAARRALTNIRVARKEKKQLEEAKEKHKARESSRKSKPTIFFLHGKWQDRIQEVSEEYAGKIDLILTDPPYDRKRSAIGYGGNRADVNSGDYDWDKLDVGWVLRFAELLAPNGSLIAFCPVEAVGLYEAAITAAGLMYKQAIIWKKTNPGVLNRDGVYLSSVEAMVFATAGKNAYFKPFKNKGSRITHNQFEGGICQGNERVGHPTQKPLWLIEKLIKRHSQRKDMILDPFCGAGTTAVAAKTLGRYSIGIELEKKWLKKASTRLKAL
jgi:DNA modification methylase